MRRKTPYNFSLVSKELNQGLFYFILCNTHFRRYKVFFHIVKSKFNGVNAKSILSSRAKAILLSASNDKWRKFNIITHKRKTNTFKRTKFMAGKSISIKLR